MKRILSTIVLTFSLTILSIPVFSVGPFPGVAVSSQGVDTDIDGTDEFSCSSGVCNIDPDDDGTVEAYIDEGTIVLDEAADHAHTPAAGEGGFWVRNDAPNTAMFTDDAGNDQAISIGHATVFYALNAEIAAVGACARLDDNAALANCNSVFGSTRVPFNGTPMIHRIDCLVGPVTGEAEGDSATFLVTAYDTANANATDQSASLVIDLSPTLTSGEIQGAAINEILPHNGGSWALQMDAFTGALISDADFVCTVLWSQG